MLKYTYGPKLRAFSCVTLIAALSACTQSAENSAISGNAAGPNKGDLYSLSAAKYQEPICFAHHDRGYDGVASLYKDTSGKIIGKTFGVQKASSKSTLQPFKQELEGRYVDNYKIQMDTLTYFDDNRIRRTETVFVKGQTLTLGKFKHEAGNCTVLVNRFLERDIERRSESEAAAKRAI